MSFGRRYDPNLEALRKEIKILREEQAALKARVFSLEKALPQCGVCHKPIDPDHGRISHVASGASYHVTCETLIPVEENDGWDEIQVRVRVRRSVFTNGGDHRAQPNNIRELVEEVDRRINASWLGGQFEMECEVEDATGCAASELSPEEIYQAERCMSRLLALEPLPEDREAIKRALEPGWESDWAEAFGRAARKVYGK